MNLVKETAFLFKRKLKETLRQPTWFMGGIMTPLMYILLFSPLLKNMSYPAMTTAEVLDVFVPGVLTLLAFGSGMGAGWMVVWELQSGVTERFRVTPARRFSLLLGGVLHDVLMFLVPACLVIIISVFFGFTVHIGGLLITLLLLCLLTAIVSAWSASLGLIIKNVGGLAAFVTGLQLPLTLLSGVLIPLSYGPKWLEVLAHINPLYYTVEASRVLSGGAIVQAEVLIAFCVIIPLVTLTLWCGTRVYKKALS